MQQLLEANRHRPQGEAGGPPNGDQRCSVRLLRCGRCGRKLYVAYSGTTGRVPRYICHGVASIVALPPVSPSAASASIGRSKPRSWTPSNPLVTAAVEAPSASAQNTT